MPLFTINAGSLVPVNQANFNLEKELQTLVEANLEAVFNCRFIASEFMTGMQHGGRIDTLALSEDNNPVIIEYKKSPTSELITQSLFYLSWIHDHRGDFEIAAQKAIKGSVSIDWTDVRVICIAPNYKKYDLHAVQVMGANIELWTYRLFGNGTLYFEEILQKAQPAVSTHQIGNGPTKNPVMVEAGKKAAVTKATETWTLDQHIGGKPEPIRQLVLAARDYILGLDPAIEEAPKKTYLAYRMSQNLVCIEVQHKKIVLYLKLDPKKVPGPPGISRDVSEIGHFGTGDLEILVHDAAQFELAKPYIDMTYQKVGG